MLPILSIHDIASQSRNSRELEPSVPDAFRLAITLLPYNRKHMLAQARHRPNRRRFASLFHMPIVFFPPPRFAAEAGVLTFLLATADDPDGVAGPARPGAAGVKKGVLLD